MDKIRFYISYNRIHELIILILDKFILLTDLNNRMYIISIKSIDGRGKIILPMLILCSIQILEKWVPKNNLVDNISLATVSITYFTNELTL